MEKKVIEEEINEVVNFVVKYKQKWGKDILMIVDKGTVEDRAFIEIFEHNKEQLGTLIRKERFVLTELENPKQQIIINTDSLLLKQIRVHSLKTNYTLNVFAGYKHSFLKEILKYYNVDTENLKPTNYGVSKELLENLKKYFEDNFDSLLTLEKEQRQELFTFLKEKTRNTNISNIKLKLEPNSEQKQNK